MRFPPARRPLGWLVDGAALGAALIAWAAVARSFGFDHVSDDDFARVTIAQQLAVAPRLDPSGTSWLPLPFYWTGAFSAALGRTLEAARAGALCAAFVSVLFVAYAAQRAGLPRGARTLALLATTATPWTAWLASAPVPELPTTALSLGAALLVASERRDRTALAVAGAATFIACLSRYEAWPVAVVVSVIAAASARRSTPLRGAQLGLSLAALAGPATWIAWNAHAHGDALHFFRRVARYKLALDGGASPSLGASLFYPRLVLEHFGGVLAVAALAALLAGRPSALRACRVPALAALAQLLFLAAGNARGGAPTHHAERAVLLTAWVLALVVGISLDALWRSRAWPSRLAVGATVTAGAIAAVAALRTDIPGTGPQEAREAQIAKGLTLRGASAVELEPCSYEHFALMAAFGAPERVVVHERRQRTAVTPACPVIERITR